MKATSDDFPGAVPDDAPSERPVARSDATARERAAAAEREVAGPRPYYRAMAHFFSSYARRDAPERDEGG